MILGAVRDSTTYLISHLHTTHLSHNGVLLIHKSWNLQQSSSQHDTTSPRVTCPESVSSLDVQTREENAAVIEQAVARADDLDDVKASDVLPGEAMMKTNALLPSTSVKEGSEEDEIVQRR